MDYTDKQTGIKTVNRKNDSTNEPTEIQGKFLDK